MMIIWINGAFGAGKTQTAFELASRLPRTLIYDPENMGYFLRNNLPPELYTGDFQDIPQWRTINVQILEKLAVEYDGDVVVPMTLTSPEYFDEIIGSLRRSGFDVRHFILFASQVTLNKRLNSRLERKNAWSRQQIARCLSAFTSDITEGRIDTDNMSVSQIAGLIAGQIGKPLKPDNSPEMVKRLRRRVLQIKHLLNDRGVK